MGWWVGGGDDGNKAKLSQVSLWLSLAAVMHIYIPMYSDDIFRNLLVPSLYSYAICQPDNTYYDKIHSFLYYNTGLDRAGCIVS